MILLQETHYDNQKSNVRKKNTIVWWHSFDRTSLEQPRDKLLSVCGHLHLQQKPSHVKEKTNHLFCWLSGHLVIRRSHGFMTRLFTCLTWFHQASCSPDLARWDPQVRQVVPPRHVSLFVCCLSQIQITARQVVSPPWWDYHLLVRFPDPFMSWATWLRITSVPGLSLSLHLSPTNPVHLYKVKHYCCEFWQL